MASERDRLEGALWGLFIGDALAAPVHWYYTTSKMDKDYPEAVTDYIKPKDIHPESMLLGMTYKGTLDITGSAENKQYYEGMSSGGKHRDAHGNDIGAPADQRPHYHKGLDAGENTANLKITKLLMETVLQRKADGAFPPYDPMAFLDALVEFMQKPGKEGHGDTYLEFYLRDLFTNLSVKQWPKHGAATDQRDRWSIGSTGCMLNSLALAGLYIKQAHSQVLARALEQQAVTHKTVNGAAALCAIVPLLKDLVEGKLTLEAAARAGLANVSRAKIRGDKLQEMYVAHKGPGNIPKDLCWKLHLEKEAEVFLAEAESLIASEAADREVVGSLISTACYTEHSIPATLFFALKYGTDFERAMVANISCGGDNTSRGALLGCFLGAGVGKSGIPERWITGLKAHDELAALISQWCDLALGEETLF